MRCSPPVRINNFLIWQLAYSELYFVDTLWPDFSDDDLDKALNWFIGRQRRFGKTGEQVIAENKKQGPDEHGLDAAENLKSIS